MLLKSFTVFFVLFTSKPFCNGQKRHLVFEGSPVFKLVIGVGVPVKLDESGKSLSWFTNLQVKYKLPESISEFIPDGYKNGRSVKHDFDGDLFHEALNRIFRRLNPMATDEDFSRLVCDGTRSESDDYPGISEDIWSVVRQEIFKSKKFDTPGGCRKNVGGIHRCHDYSLARETYAGEITGLREELLCSSWTKPGVVGLKN